MNFDQQRESEGQSRFLPRGTHDDQKKKILEFGKAEMFGICKAQYSERRKLQRRSCRNLH